MAKLKFHQKIFDLLSIAPLPSEQIRRALDDAARSANAQLPAAALEWFSLENGGPLLRRTGRTSEAISSKLLMASLAATAGVRKPRLIFLRESAGDSCWAFDLDKNPDPPVFIRIPDGNGTRESWRTTSDHFSDFIFGWIWDNPQSGLTAQAQLNLTLRQTRRMAAGATEHPIARAWPTHKTFRFQLGDGRIRIHYQPDGWSSVVLWAPALKTLTPLVEHLTSAGIPKKSFFSDQPLVSRLLTN